VYPVEVRYRPPPSGEEEERSEWTQEGAIVGAVNELAREGKGDVLVFLSGEREIRETAEALRKQKVSGENALEVLPLYARLSVDAQMKVFAPHAGRRVVLATNVAETSLTVPGIRYVVDTGFARISRYSARTRVQRLPIEPVSRASADQRKGRCGRVAEGVCIRLYSEQDFLSRPEFTDPEILRTNLASVILQMKSLRLGAIDEFPFVERPDERMVKDGYDTLHELGALDHKHELTKVGHDLARLPMDPRIGRMILAAGREGSLAEVLVIASALSVIDPRERPHEEQEKADAAHAKFADPESDFTALVNLWKWYQQQAMTLNTSKLRKLCKESYLSYIRMREWVDVHRQLLELTDEMELKINREPATYDAVHRALLTGLLGNVGTRVDAVNYQGVRGQRFNLFPGSGLFEARPKWVMSAELVKTTKLYARTAARIDPKWIEELGAHLIKKHYSDPHWKMDAAQVRAYERVTLGMLELVAGRKVHYGPIEPVLSREMFIHNALVEGEFRTRAPFVAHNKAMIEEVRALEAKRRRRDLLVEARAIFEFYASRVPENVYSGVQFERWRQWIERDKPDLLLMTRNDLLQPGRDDFAGGEEYPDSVEMNGVVFKLEYAFEPGEANDGVTLVAPVEQAWAIDPERAAWAVPGLLRERVIAMIRSLPKEIRVNFVPVPEYADKAMRGIEGDPGSLEEALGEELGRLSGVIVPRDAWRAGVMPEHLRMNYRIVGAQGKILAEGREFAQVREAVAGYVRQMLAVMPSGAWNRGPLEEWDFDELPERVTIAAGSTPVEAFPAIVVEGQGVALRLRASAGEAARDTRGGLRRLFAAHLVDELKFKAGDISGFERMAKQFSAHGGKAALRGILAELVAERAYMGDEPVVRTRADYEARLELGWNRWSEAETEVEKTIGAVLNEWEAFEKKAGVLTNTAWAFAIGEAREHVARLTRLGFLLETPWEWLKQYPRYLAAARKRLEKLGPDTLGRDAEHSRELGTLWEQYEARHAAHAHQGIWDAELERYRWMLEEYRVSLFAQELGTAHPVSAKRLERLWEKVKR